MPVERELFECRADSECDASFITKQARNGHESTHAEETLGERR